MRIKFGMFFRDDKNAESMSRLLPFMAFFPATIALLWIHTEGALTAYLGAYALHYGVSKCAETYACSHNKGGSNADDAN
jgi:hypothetical protein